MNATRQQRHAIDRQPFTEEQAIEFCGTKKLARAFMVDLGEALESADRARRRGDSDDTEFELMFWDGTLFNDDADLWEMGVHCETIADFAMWQAYDEKLDATFSLCRHPGYDNRKFIVVRYEFKEDCYAITCWWLTRN